MAYWQNRIKESNDVGFLLNELVASDEFHVLHNDVSRETFIRSLYENGLGRAPDEEGLQFWLHSSFSYADLLKHFVISEEYLEREHTKVREFHEDVADNSQDYTGSLFDVDVPQITGFVDDTGGAGR
ncbi:DUF4214 domain-containing protein [Pseudochelatococcus sp. B33]